MELQVKKQADVGSQAAEEFAKAVQSPNTPTSDHDPGEAQTDGESAQIFIGSAWKTRAATRSYHCDRQPVVLVC